MMKRSAPAASAWVVNVAPWTAPRGHAQCALDDRPTLPWDVLHTRVHASPPFVFCSHAVPRRAASCRSRARALGMWAVRGLPWWFAARGETAQRPGWTLASVTGMASRP